MNKLFEAVDNLESFTLEESVEYTIEPFEDKYIIRTYAGCLMDTYVDEDHVIRASVILCPSDEVSSSALKLDTEEEAQQVIDSIGTSTDAEPDETVDFNNLDKWFNK